MRHSAYWALVLAITLGLCASLRADTVVMKGGQTLEGEVVSEDGKGIELKVEVGIMRVPKSRILRIEEDTPEKILERENKAAEERDLAERMQEEGKVKYKGKWVTEAEKKTAEDKLAAAKKKKEQERAAAKKKADEEAKRKADEDKRLAQQQQQQNQQNQFANPSDRWRQQRQDWRDANLDPNSMYGTGNSSRRGSYNSNQYGGGYSSGGIYNPLSNFRGQNYSRGY